MMEYVLWNKSYTMSDVSVKENICKHIHKVYKKWDFVT